MSYEFIQENIWLRDIGDIIVPSDKSNSKISNLIALNNPKNKQLLNDSLNQSLSSLFEINNRDNNNNINNNRNMNYNDPIYYINNNNNIIINNNIPLQNPVS